MECDDIVGDGIGTRRKSEGHSRFLLILALCIGNLLARIKSHRAFHFGLSRHKNFGYLRIKHMDIEQIALAGGGAPFLGREITGIGVVECLAIARSPLSQRFESVEGCGGELARRLRTYVE